jgi:hypothetical protein
MKQYFFLILFSLLFNVSYSQILDTTYCKFKVESPIITEGGFYDGFDNEFYSVIKAINDSIFIRYDIYNIFEPISVSSDTFKIVADKWEIKVNGCFKCFFDKSSMLSDSIIVMNYDTGIVKHRIINYCDSSNLFELERSYGHPMFLHYSYNFFINPSTGIEKMLIGNVLFIKVEVLDDKVIARIKQTIDEYEERKN